MDRSKNRSSSKGGSSSKTLDKKSSSRRTSEFRDLKASTDKYSSSTFKEKEEKYDVMTYGTCKLLQTIGF